MSVVTANEAVRSKGLLVEEDCLAHPAPRVKLQVVVGFKAPHFDAQFLEQLFRLGAVQIRARNRLRSAVSDQCLPAASEFVAFGMTAEIVVVVENQNARPV